MTAKLTHADIWSLPKIDLHRHLDGDVQPEFIIQLAKDSGVKLPTYELDEFTKLCQIIDPKNMPIDELFKRFAWAIAVMRTPRGLYRMAREHVYNLARENILYTETRIAPGYHSIYPPPWYAPAAYEEKLFRVMSLDEVVQSVLSGLNQGMIDTGVEVNLTLCIPRESLSVYGQKSVTDIVDLALRYQHQGVVAIDLACDEFTYSPDPYAEYFLATLESNIHRELHVDEMVGQKIGLRNIATGIEKFSPHGIIHAIHLYLSEYLMWLTRVRNIRVARTPLSPVPGCSLAEGRLDLLMQNRVPVVITSDDPQLMRASLTDNLVAALNFYEYGEEEYWQLQTNALNTAFYRDESQKKRVLQAFLEQRLFQLLM